MCKTWLGITIMKSVQMFFMLGFFKHSIKNIYVLWPARACSMAYCHLPRNGLRLLSAPVTMRSLWLDRLISCAHLTVMSWDIHCVTFAYVLTRNHIVERFCRDFFSTCAFIYIYYIQKDLHKILTNFLNQVT